MTLFLCRYLTPLAPVSLGDGVVVAGGVVVLAGGVVVLDGAGTAEAAPGSALLGAGVWLGGDCIGPEVPPVPVGVGTSGALVSSIGGGVLVGLGVPGVVASGRAGSGATGAGVSLLGSFGAPPDVSNGVRLVPFTLFGRGGGTVSVAGLPGGWSSEPEPWFGCGLPGVPGACASCIPLTSGAACVRHTFIV